MAEDSVRDLVRKIDKRTSDLEPVLEKLSKSLDNIASSFAKQSGGVSSREDLLEKFRSPFMQSVKPGGGGKDSSLDVLDEIKKLLDRNHKESFPIFQSIESTLKKIEEKGGSIGGGVTDLFGGGKGGKGAKGAKGAKVPTASVASEAAEKGAKKGVLGKAAGALGKAARFIPGVGLAVAGGMAGYDAVTAGMDAEDTLGIKDRKATLGETLSAGAGGLVEGLTMGLVSRKTAGKGIAGFFGAGPSSDDTPTSAPTSTKPVSTAGAIAAANAGRLPPTTTAGTSTEPAIKQTAISQIPTPTATVASAPSVSTSSSEPVGPVPTVSLPDEKPKEQSSVKPAPNKSSTKAAAASSSSVFSSMEGEENLAKMQDKEADLQDLQAEYKEEKQKVSQKLAGDVEKYPEGFISDPSDPEYAPELKAVDDKYLPKIESLKKEIGELAKAPGVKEARAREDREDAEDTLLDEEFLEEPAGKVKSESATVKSTSTVMQTETTETSGGGSTINRMTDVGRNKNKELVDLESQEEDEIRALSKTRRAEGKKRGVAELESDERYQAIKAKYEEKRAGVKEKYEGRDTYEQVKIDSPPSTTTSSTTVNQMSQENMDMRSEGQAGQPVVLNNSSSVATNTQTFTPLRASARPNNNSFERKQNMAAAY